VAMRLSRGPVILAEAPSPATIDCRTGCDDTDSIAYVIVLLRSAPVNHESHPRVKAWSDTRPKLFVLSSSAVYPRSTPGLTG